MRTQMILRREMGEPINDMFSLPDHVSIALTPSQQYIIQYILFRHDVSVAACGGVV